MDIIFLENLFLDYILLSMVGRILHMTYKRKRILSGSVIGAVMTVVYYVFPIRGLLMVRVFRVLLAVAMILVSFGKTEKQKVMSAVLLFYGMNFLLEGMLRWMIGQMGIGSNVINRLLILCGAATFGALFVTGLFDLVKRQNYKSEQIFQVVIKTQGKSLSGVGFMDTGNSLKEPITGSAVVIVEKDFLMRNGVREPETGYFAIPFRAVGCEAGILKGFFVDEMIIRQKDKQMFYQKVMLGIYEGKLCSKDTYQLLLNPAL